MKRVGFVVHPEREAAHYAADRLAGWLEERGIETRWLRDDPVHRPQRARAFVEGLDLVVSVGGDGTFLHAAHVASRVEIPILGVKVGRLGFLTEVDPDEAPEILQDVLDGRSMIEERIAVVAEAVGPTSFEPQWALNEIIVEKKARHRLVRLAAYVDDVYVTTFSADGVIVATPTGSTAYSFSGGGPIVTPTVPCLIVTPVAAHMVFDRSLVLGADERVTLQVVGDEDGVVSADGRESLDLPIGASIHIARAPNPALLVRGKDTPDFHALLREKFDLPGEDPGHHTA